MCSTWNNFGYSMNKTLSGGAKELGFPLAPDEIRLFELYLAELLKWNVKVNLTAITEPEEIVVKHFLDSLALRLILPLDSEGTRIGRTTALSRRAWPETGGGREAAAGLPPERGGASTLRSGAAAQSPALSQNFSACDIGSGAGFPGLVLKVVLPGMALTLVEPIHKKAVFLRHVIRTLDLSPVTALEARAEGLPDKISAPFDIVFSRAFKAPAELLPLAAPILKDGGLAALSLGPGMEYEPQPGWTVEREEEITLPFSDIRRKLVLLRKG
jgi:16S rRNA (guanine527-N7)-methyltransferase